MSGGERAIGSGSEIDGFRLGEMMHVGSMASIYRLDGVDGPLPLIMKIPRLGPGERAVNVIGFEVCRMVLGGLAQSRHHPTLVAYGDIETTPYLVMEFVEGTRLRDWVERAPLSTGEIVRLGSALAIALQDLHQQDVVHLDLKPTNVLYREDGEVVLIDFGLAHHGHYPDLLAEELRFPVGNWVYMSPEQLSGVRSDPRSDIFSLGAMLYELATGRVPFGKPDSIAELRKRLYVDPVPPRAIIPAFPPWLQEIIFRCLEVDANKRYASAEQIAFDLANPSGVVLTERAERQHGLPWWTRLNRRIRARRFEPAPCPPRLTQQRVTRVTVVALAPQEADERLREALRIAARQVIASDPDCRIACVTVVPPAASLIGEGEEYSATGRHIKRLVELRRWAKALELPEDRVTFHVLEADKSGQGLVDYVKLNDVEQVLIGAPTGRFVGVCAQVVMGVPCNVIVVRARSGE
jgi:eukaryotic-like serine/threonine-protein kinase